MLFERHKCLLALLDSLGGEIGSRDFQKLLFLYCSEVEDLPSYEFVPYKYGGFSFTSYADKRRLISQGLLADMENCWKLTSSGRQSCSLVPRLRIQIDQFSRRHASLRGDDLVAEVYRKHPYYAIRSEIAAKVLAGDVAALREIHMAVPAKSSPGVVTIGYEGRSLEAYLNLLLKSAVTILCDVRRNPLSRKYGFSKGTLSKSCESLGIRYEHIPELGIASDERRDLNSQADYDALFQSYEENSLPHQTEALDKIRGWVNGGHRVALTCYEHLPHQCHRHCVAEALEQRMGRGLHPQHL